MSSMRARLIAICLAITVFSLAVLSVATLLLTRNNAMDELDRNVGQLTKVYASELAGWIEEKQRISSAIEDVAFMDDPVPFLKAIAKAGGFSDAYFGLAVKRFFGTQPMPEGFDGTQRPWYKQAIQAKGPVLTPPYLDVVSGKLAIAFARPLGSVDNPVGVYGTDMLLEDVTEVIKSIHPSEQSFAFLMDGEGNLLAHPSDALVGKHVSQVGEAFQPNMLRELAQRGGHAEVDLNGAAQFLYAAPVKGAPWVLAISMDAKAATAHVQQLLMLSIGIAIACVVVAVALVTVAVSQQMRRLGQIRDALDVIASGEGDLTVRLSTHGNDELAQIARAFNRFVDKIASVLVRIRDASEMVRHATQEIASGNQDLSNRTEQQAGALEETAAAMQQLTSTVQQNAESAKEADKLVGAASSIATQGGQVMQQMVQTMEGIDASSQKISDIIGVIDGIAFQTNILALNAAVEAARAGEQGRGFAVVASEVRTLAQRSASAAKEIKALIQESVSQVTDGSARIKTAGSTMDEVVRSVQRVTSIVESISVATQNQSRDISEIGGAVNQMDQGTQQNAALVEQASAASHALQQQARELAEAVAGFRLPQLDRGTKASNASQVAMLTH